MSSFSSKVKTAAVLASSVAIALSISTPSFAGTGTNCSSSQTDGCITLYYNSNYQNGRFSIWDQNVPDLVWYVYGGSGAGVGQTVKNNAASAKFTEGNNFGYNYVKVHFNSNYGGACDMMFRNHGAPQLVNTYNDNASVEFGYDSKCYLF